MATVAGTATTLANADLPAYDRPMSAPDGPSDTDKAPVGPPEDPTGAPKPPTEREPCWSESGLDPAFVEAARRVFERRRDLLRRLA